MTVVGFVGLGNMGGALAANLVGTGSDLVCYDVAGSSRLPVGASWAPDLADLARRADIAVLSLPDGTVSEQVAREIAAAENRRVSHVVDTSTTGVSFARSIARQLAEAGMGYVDAPVSGGVAGARARTITVMFAGNDTACQAVESVLEGLSDRRFRVGDEPGLAQALKLANNFLSATALAATSEAVAFGTSVGLDIAVMIDVLNTSSGHNSATGDKFPNHVVTGSFAAGFANSLMAKDVALYVDAVRADGRSSPIGEITAALWESFAAAEPGADFTRIYPFVADR